MQAYAKQNGGKLECLFSDLSVNAKPSHKLRARFICSNPAHEAWDVHYRQPLAYGGWCRCCVIRTASAEIQAIRSQKLRDRVRAKIREKNGLLISPESAIVDFKSKIEVCCLEHGNFHVTVNGLLNGKGGRLGRGVWCAKCKSEHLRIQFAHEASDVIARIAETKWVFLGFNGGEYKNIKTRALCRCGGCGREHAMAINKIINGLQSCPYCFSRKSRGEEVVRLFFERIFGKLFPKCRPEFLNNLSPSVGQLEYDGYCAELGIAYEYDGYPTHQECDRAIMRDRLKDEASRKNRVTLVRIGLIESGWRIEKWRPKIEQAIRDAGIGIDEINYDGFDPFLVTISVDEQAKIRAIEEKTNCVYLEPYYVGVDEPSRWCCNLCGSEFTSTFYVMQGRKTTGCRACSYSQYKRRKSITRSDSLVAESFENLKSIARKRGVTILDPDWIRLTERPIYQTRCDVCGNISSMRYGSFFNDTKTLGCKACVKEASGELRRNNALLRNSDKWLKNFSEKLKNNGYRLIDSQWRGALHTYQAACLSCGMLTEFQPAGKCKRKCGTCGNTHRTPFNAKI